jgi:hypothetical protein
LEPWEGPGCNGDDGYELESSNAVSYCRSDLIALFIVETVVSYSNVTLGTIISGNKKFRGCYFAYQTVVICK